MSFGKQPVLYAAVLLVAVSAILAASAVWRSPAVPAGEPDANARTMAALSAIEKRFSALEQSVAGLHTQIQTLGATMGSQVSDLKQTAERIQGAAEKLPSDQLLQDQIAEIRNAVVQTDGLRQELAQFDEQTKPKLAALQVALNRPSAGSRGAGEAAPASAPGPRRVRAPVPAEPPKPNNGAGEAAPLPLIEPAAGPAESPQPFWVNWAASRMENEATRGAEGPR